MAFFNSKDSSLGTLIRTLPQTGTLTWIGVRPARSAPLQALETVEAITDKNLAGDHYSGKPGSKRQVTLIQAEHIAAVASMLHRSEIDPGLLRRNLVVQGINLLALKDQQFWVGDVLLQVTGLCHPCSRMEANLGPGGYNAMRGHGGLTARILQGGFLHVGDVVRIDL
ncbi:MOSC domain-containing protein [Adhaeribacter swui]|uniref:MOSC domain-containing protein n=1 Tax=Adhaeribacter swui TaxID=2086471 RepID=A0A7G7G6X9_9BACT|nr:MOSC domain-containing protein [Adhaeribacter swui]QNF32913.1 MOSC domain-containing protein [Adhaeribacter swui]